MKTRVGALPWLALLSGSWACTDAREPPAPDHAATEVPSDFIAGLDRQFPRTSPEASVSIRQDNGELSSRIEDHRSRSPLAVVLPNTSSDPVHLRARGGELGIRFRLVDARPSRAQVFGDKVAYAQAGPSKADVALRVGPRGVEDFLYFREAPRKNSVSYQVALDAVHAVRLVSNTVEYIDASGVPRLRTTRPVLRDARGNKRFGTTTLSGCAYDSDPEVPWGRPLVSPDSDHCELTVSWDGAGLVPPITLDPGWVATDDLADARSFHTATALDDGEVLVAGGQQDGTPLASTEVYDDDAEAWAMAGDLRRARYSHTATKLDNGSVLLLGGYGENEARVTVSENYVGGSWVSVTPLPEGRAEHTATLLPDGSTVVVIGGGGADALVYDSEAATWGNGGTASTDRYGHAAVYVDGAVMVVGGSSTPLPSEDALTSVESFDPPAGPFTQLPPMNFGRHGHTITRLDDVRVLVVGKARDAEIYDTLNQRWEVTATPPTAGRWYHAAVELESSDLGAQVLFVGGLFGNTTYDSSEFFVPDGETWTRLDLRMNAKRYAHRATPLNPGAVLLSGGQEGFGEPLAVTEKVVFIEPGEPCDTSGECFTGYCVDGVCCESACEGDCSACSEARGSSADGACDVLPDGLSCSAGTGVCAVESTCDGESPTCEVSDWETNGRSCDDEADDTQNDRCQQGICRGSRVVDPPPGGGAGTGGEPGSGGSGGSAGSGGSGASGGSGGSGGMTEEPEPEDEVVPTPLSCSVRPGDSSSGSSGMITWWVLLGFVVGRPRAGRRVR